MSSTGKGRAERRSELYVSMHSYSPHAAGKKRPSSESLCAIKMATQGDGGSGTGTGATAGGISSSQLTGPPDPEGSSNAQPTRPPASTSVQAVHLDLRMLNAIVVAVTAQMRAIVVAVTAQMRAAPAQGGTTGGTPPTMGGPPPTTGGPPPTMGGPPPITGGPPPMTGGHPPTTGGTNPPQAFGECGGV